MRAASKASSLRRSPSRISTAGRLEPKGDVMNSQCTTGLPMTSPLGSKRPAVEILDGERRKLDAFEAARIHCRHLVAFRIGGFAERVDAAIGAEAVLDGVLVEQVGAQILLRRQQMQFLARNEPHKHSLPGAHRAVARRDVLDLAFHLEGDLAAVAAAFVDHAASACLARFRPSMSIFLICIIAFMTLCEIAGSGSLSSSSKASGVICQLRPNLSLSQPHMLSCPPPASSLSQ